MGKRTQSILVSRSPRWDTVSLCRVLRCQATNCRPIERVAPMGKQHQETIHLFAASHETVPVANRIRDAQLPRVKTLEDFDFSKAPQIPAAKIRDLAQG